MSEIGSKNDGPLFIPHSNGSIPKNPSCQSPTKTPVRFLGKEIQLTAYDLNTSEVELQKIVHAKVPPISNFNGKADPYESETVGEKLTVFTLLKRNGLVKVEPIVDLPSSSSSSVNCCNDLNNNCKEATNKEIPESGCQLQGFKLETSSCKPQDGEVQLPSKPPSNSSDETSVPSPDWATKLMNSYERRNSTLNARSSVPLSHSQMGMPSYSRNSSISLVSSHHPDHGFQVEPKLTDLRKILNPEAEKRDFETLLKAHWETFLDCGCFECSFNNAAKLVTVMVLGVTLFLVIKALMEQER